MESDKTLDLGELARLQAGEYVEVQRLGTTDETDDFQRTIELLATQARGAAAAGKTQPLDPAAALDTQPQGTDASPAAAPPAKSRPPGFVPDNEQLRTVFLFAEAVGGYQQLHDLVYTYSPGLNLIAQVRDTVATKPLRPLQVRDLTSYRADIMKALGAARDYIRDQGTGQFSLDDVRQLNEVLTEARHRADQIDRILGANLAHELEAAVKRLHELRETTRMVDQTVTGIFLVENKVLFMPTEELMTLIATLFRGLGNPYLADNVNGITLLAARNLLIQVVAFYSYYGRHQIYNMLKRTGVSLSTKGVTEVIRREIRRVFAACQDENRLVLRRVMREAEENFELSIEAIQREAELSAVEAVQAMAPKPKQAPVRRRSWWRRLFAR